MDFFIGHWDIGKARNFGPHCQTEPGDISPGLTGHVVRSATLSLVEIQNHSFRLVFFEFLLPYLLQM